MPASISQLTDNCWTFKSPTHNGLLTKKNNEYILMTTQSLTKYSSMEDIKLSFGKISVIERDNSEPINTINGYPVKDKNFLVSDEDNGIYVKKNSYSTSKIEFRAGFWSIKYPNGWFSTLCPKQSTLDSYDHNGPFRTKLESTNETSRSNNRDNVKK